MLVTLPVYEKQTPPREPRENSKMQMEKQSPIKDFSELRPAERAARLKRVAEHLRERYSHLPYYKNRTPEHWLSMATGAVNRVP